MHEIMLLPEMQHCLTKVKILVPESSLSCSPIHHETLFDLNDEIQPRLCIDCRIQRRQIPLAHFIKQLAY